MNRVLSNVLLFTAGVVVGSAVTWKIFKSKYEIVNEAFDDDGVEEAEDEPDDSSEEEEQSPIETSSNLNKKPPLKEYVDMVNRFGYSAAEAPDDEEEPDVYEPYIIRPEEYGEIHAYDTQTLYYYEVDGVLTDELDNRIEDVESMVVADFADHFGDNLGDEDSVFVRNDNRQCDYEILRDTRAFADVVGDDPYPTEDE